MPPTSGKRRKWQHPGFQLAVWGRHRLLTALALPGACGRSNAGGPRSAVSASPERIGSSDLASSTPAKSISKWQRERWVAPRPVLASWTCFSLSGSAGLAAVSSGMNLPWGGGKLGELQPEWEWWCALGFLKLLPGRRRLSLGLFLLSGSPGLLVGSPGQNRGALVKQ